MFFLKRAISLLGRGRCSSYEGKEGREIPRKE